jgi:hypothetical protein
MLPEITIPIKPLEVTIIPPLIEQAPLSPILSKLKQKPVLRLKKQFFKDRSSSEGGSPVYNSTEPGTP